MKIIFLITLSLNILIANIDLSIQTSKIYDIETDTAKIDIVNLKIGQSGIVVHQTNKNKLILSQATITKSNSNYSIITFIQKDILLQDAIPTSKLKPSTNDKFILNHLYQTSLLIVPNIKAKKEILSLYKNQNFLDEDFFASYLKLVSQPTPTKKDITNFTHKQQIGTIFLVIKNNLYIVDALTFKVLDTIEIEINDETTKKPFLTKIDEITRGFWDFGPDSIENYNEYYSKLLNIK
ncbi:MAG: plasminogen-binding N-terminal domain-containing protein [Campylobacterota bacterium]|nr:plasminogen-binding N-terminal domain-containing protein [Campylobacterota bacterium]